MGISILHYKVLLRTSSLQELGNQSNTITMNGIDKLQLVLSFARPVHSTIVTIYLTYKSAKHSVEDFTSSIYSLKVR